MRSTAICIATFLANLLIAFSPVAAEIPWQKNLRDAHAKAQAEGKMLLLHFYGDNCVWCDRLEAGAFQSPEVEQAILQRYVPVKVHAQRNPKITSTFQVKKLPTDVIVTTDGKAMEHRISPQDPNAYIGMLAGVSIPQTSNARVAVANQTQAPTSQTPTSRPAPQTAPSNAPPSYVVAPQPSQQQAVPQRPTPQLSTPTQNLSISTQNLPTSTQNLSTSTQNLPTSTQNLSTSTQNLSTSTQNTVPAQPRHPSASPHLGGLAMTQHQPTAPTFAPPTTPPSPAQAPAANNGFVLPSGIANQPAGPTNQLVSSRKETSTIGVPVATQPAAAAVAAPQEVVISPEPTATKRSVAQKPSETVAPAPKSTRPELALDGFCPVTVVGEDAWLEGNPEFGVVHLGKLYLFASAAKMETFLADPAPYTPMLNEIDVVRFFEEHVIVPGKRDFGVTDPIHKRIFLFADEDAMNHFMEAYERYTEPSIKLMETAVREANTKR